MVTKTSEISPGVATLVDALAQSGHGPSRFRNGEISPGTAAVVDDPVERGHGFQGQIAITVHKIQHQKVAMPRVLLFGVAHVRGVE